MVGLCKWMELMIGGLGGGPVGQWTMMAARRSLGALLARCSCGGECEPSL